MVNIVGYSQDAPVRAAPAQQHAYGQDSSFGYDNIAGAVHRGVLLPVKLSNIVLRDPGS